MATHALITAQLDFLNVLYVVQSLTEKVQPVQAAAAMFVKG